MLGLYNAKNQSDRVNALTKVHANSSLHLFLAASLLIQTCGPVFAANETKRTFTHQVDIRPGKEDALIDIFKPLSTQFSTESRSLGALYTMGEVFFYQKRYKESVRSFSDVLSKAKRGTYLNDATKVRLAESYLLEGNYEMALKTAQEVSASSNRFIGAESWYTTARAYLAQNKIDKAEEALQRVSSINPAYDSLLKMNLVKGLIAFQKGAYPEALTHFSKNTDDIPSIYYTIASHCQTKDVAKAVSAYQSLLAKAKKGTWVDRARVLIGESIYQSHDYDLAMTFFGPVSRTDAPGDLRVLALYRLACIDFMKKNYTRCELTLQNLLRDYPNHPVSTDWMYLLATIPVYERDWSRTIRDEGKFTSVRKANLGPRSIPPDQLVPEAEFRVIWAHMAIGSYNEVIKQTQKFFSKYTKNPLSGYALLLQGVAYDQLHNMEKAIDAYQTLVDLYPQSPAAGKAVYLMTLSLHRANEPSRIVSALNHLNENLVRQQEIKSDPWRKNTLYWIAEGYSSIQDWKHAEESYRKFVELAPDSPLTPYALQGLGASLAAQGPEKLDQARVYMQQARTRARDLGNTAVENDAVLQLGKIAYNQKKFENAAQMFDAFINAPTPSTGTATAKVAEALYNNGLALYNQQYYSEAIQQWKRVIDGYRYSPFRSLAYLKTGQTQFGLAKFDQAIAAYQALSANYPNTPEAQEAQFQIIQCYYNKGDVRGAFQQFMAFKNAYPVDDRIKGVAELLLSAYQGQAGASGNLHSGELSELLRSTPGSNAAAAILWERGAALFNKKDYAAAQKYFQRIMLSYPNDEYAPQAYYYNAECYFNLKNMDQSASAYKSFYINYPSDKMVPQAMFQVGISFFNKKDYVKAAEAFNELVLKFPNDEKAKDAALNVALCYKKSFKLDEAIKAYDAYARNYAGDAKAVFIRLQIADLHAQKGNYSEAIKQYELIPSGTAERVQAQYNIGQIYQNMNKVDDAEKAYAKLLSMGPRDNEHRLAGLLELAKSMETRGAAGNQLVSIYSEIAASSKDQNIALMAQQKVKELKGGN